MFYCQAKRLDISAVHHYAGSRRVGSPAERARVAVVRTPRPDVVQDYVGAVHLQAYCGSTLCGTPDAEENVVERSWLGLVVLVGYSRLSNLHKDGGSDRSGIEE